MQIVRRTEAKKILRVARTGKYERKTQLYVPTYCKFIEIKRLSWHLISRGNERDTRAETPLARKGFLFEVKEKRKRKKEQARKKYLRRIAEGYKR